MNDEARMTKPPARAGFGFRHLDFLCHSGFGFSHASGFGSKQFNPSAERVIKIVHDALLQRNDLVVGDRDTFRGAFSATHGDVEVVVEVGLLSYVNLDMLVTVVML